MRSLGGGTDELLLMRSNHIIVRVMSRVYEGVRLFEGLIVGVRVLGLSGLI
jgi:hypothetical protein